MSVPVRAGAARTSATVARVTPSTTRERNPRGQGDRLRAEILDAAAALLGESGEEAVTLRAVARQVGISAPSIYRHFPDRQAILLAVAQDAFAQLAARLRSAYDEQGEPTARLRTVCDAYLSLAREQPALYRVMFGGAWAADPSASESVTEADVVDLGQDALAVLTACLTACVDAGASASTDPEADAVALWLGLHGLAHQRTVSTRFPWPDDIEDRVIRSRAQLAG